jgi:hypothetical protein
VGIAISLSQKLCLQNFLFENITDLLGVIIHTRSCFGT